MTARRSSDLCAVILVAKEAITPPISDKKKINTVKKTEKSQASNITVDTTKINKTHKFKLIDKSRSTQITDTYNKVDKSKYIPRTNLSNKSTRIEKTSEIDNCKDNLSVSVLSGHGESLSSVTSYQKRIPRKNKRKKTSDTFIKIKENIQEPVNPSKMEP